MSLSDAYVSAMYRFYTDIGASISHSSFNNFKYATQHGFGSPKKKKKTRNSLLENKIEDNHLKYIRLKRVKNNKILKNSET